MYISRLVKTRRPHSGLLQSPSCFSSSFPLAASLSLLHLLPFIRLLSRLISPLFFIYLLSILVEVLLRLLTYRGDLVLLYLVSEDHS
jgi:membrane-bound metal-dependent hydrolase YbcI (DUF457 family)